MAIEPPILVGGLPIRTFVHGTVRRLRDTAAAIDAAMPVAPAPPPSDVLAKTLRGHGLADLFLEASRLAGEAAIHRENMEGLAVGRTYGDRSLVGLEPAPCLTPMLALATKRADQIGAIADLLRGLVGHEAEVELVLTGGAGV